MLDTLLSLIRRKRELVPQPARARLQAAEWPAVVYAIGDIHGCLDELKQLEAMIVDDASEIPGERWLVTLGDYVDRGPRSAQVVAHLMGEPPAGFRRISLAGNHEQMLLDFIDAPTHNAHWLDYGGPDTARSYGMTDQRGPLGALRPSAVAMSLRSLIPEAHLNFLRELPICLSLPGYHFVHAGIRPGIAIEAQTEEDLLWIRAPFLEQGSGTPGVTVVHGHTPVDAPEVGPWRIGIDTAAFASGRLTAVRLERDAEPRFLQSGGAR